MGEHRPAIQPDYDADFYAWTQHQARLLRTLNGLRSDLPVELDIDHVAEEIEDLGSAELNAVKSFTRQILSHLITAASEPRSEAIRHWRSEATAFSVELRDHYFPSMRQNLDLDNLWPGALKVARARLEEHGGALAEGLPATCPYELADFVTGEFSFDDALARLKQQPLAR